MLTTLRAPIGCGSSAQECLWGCLVLSPTKVGNTKDTSLALLVVDVANDKGRWRCPPVPRKFVRSERNDSRHG